MKLLLILLLASISLAAPAYGDVAVLQDAERGVRDVEHVKRDTSAVERDLRAIKRDGSRLDSAANRETDKLFHDAAISDGLLHDDHVSNDERVREDRHRKHEAEKLECDRLAFEYYLRHPPGTKPESLRGLHGCALYRQDAHYHDTHPYVQSILGDNIYIGGL